MDNKIMKTGQASTQTNESLGKVLIVDESTQNIQYLHHMLHTNFCVDFAIDEETAARMVEEEQPDLIIMNLNNDAFDSLTLCERWLVSVIMLTSQLNTADMIKSLECGAVDYLTMPVVADEFKIRLEAHISIAKNNKQDVANLTQTKSVITRTDNIGKPESINTIDKQKVLIVDDSISNIQVLNEILGDEHEIFFATNGKQAIEMALEERPDLIVLDVVMPQMDGYKVCQKLKAMQETNDIGIIFVTALNEVQDEARGLELGAIDYIVKPFSSHIVRARMHNHMELIKHRKMLNSLSMTDGMTGIANRRQFDQVIHRELHRSIRHKEALTIFLIDIDNFKKYNDHYGHVNGDECLREVANAIDACKIRMVDFVARYGGEEFAVVLPDTDSKGAKFMANKVLKAISDLAISHVNNSNFGVVTASLGVYCSIPDSQTTIESIIKIADEGLYKAKSLGRNQVVFITDHD